MGLSNYHSSSFRFLLLSTAVLPLFLFISCSEKVEAYSFKEKTAKLPLQTHHVVSLSSLMPAAVCSTPAQGSINLSRLQVAHNYGPCSPLKKRNVKIPSLRQILMDDKSRVKSIQSKFSYKVPVADSTVKLPANSGQLLGSGNFVVTIGLGTPEQNFTVAFDTASDLTFVQCQPCNINQCYPQNDPYFNPSASSTYSSIPCNSPECVELQSIIGSTQPCSTTCPYQISYADGSYTQGDLVTDTLTLASCSDVFDDFVFGCGKNNRGNFGSTDGLLGLNRDQVSIVSQTVEAYGKLFSYCLPSSISSTGFLAFGNQTDGSSSNVQYTPLITNPYDQSSYYLNLTGISVGGQMLPIEESVFITSGTIIDAGTVITRLAPKAYSALRSAFRQGMTQYRAAPSPVSIFDTCYDFSGVTTVNYPIIVLHFGGGTDLKVDASGTLFQVSQTVYCLAFTGNSDATDLGILGNTQQQTFEVVYDVEGEKLGFGAGACS